MLVRPGPCPSPVSGDKCEQVCGCRSFSLHRSQLKGKNEEKKRIYDRIKGQRGVDQETETEEKESEKERERERERGAGLVSKTKWLASHRHIRTIKASTGQTDRQTDTRGMKGREKEKERERE